MEIKVVIIGDDDGHFQAFSYKQRQDFIDHLESEKPEVFEEMDQGHLDNIDVITEEHYWDIVIPSIEQRGYIETDNIEI